MSSLPPGTPLILGALLVPLLKGRVRQALLLLLPILSFALMVSLPLGEVHVQAFGVTLTPIRVDSLSLLFGYAFHLAWFLAILFALHVKDPVQHVAACVYGGTTIGAAFAGDLVTLFVFWEGVAVSSAFLIWARRTERSYRAGLRYLAWQVVSGLLLLAGILAVVHGGGGLAFDALGLHTDGGWLASIAAEPGHWLILIAFGIKAGFPVLHVWLTDAYPEATPTGTVFLSAFTTKLAIYALARGFPGTELLIGIGTVMVVFPIFYAVIEDDLRRVLSYSLINQLGYMVVGIGVGTKLGMNGATGQVFAHIIFKSLLFMAMGAVLHQVGTIKASRLGPIYKTMPVAAVCCLVGAASISAFPPFSAFVTKSQIMDSVAEAHHPLVWGLLLFGAAGVLHHAGIKVPHCAFFGPNREVRAPGPAPLNMRLAMIGSAIVCLGIGLFPGLLYRLLPYPEHEYVPYTLAHVATQLELLAFALLAFVVLIRIGKHPHEVPSVNLDADWLLRRPLKSAWGATRAVLGRLAAAFETLVLELIPRGAAAAVRNYGPERGPLRGQWVMGSSIVIVLLLLFFFLVVGFDFAPPPAGH